MLVELKGGSQQPWQSCCSGAYFLAVSKCQKGLFLCLRGCSLQPSLLFTPLQPRAQQTQLPLLKSLFRYAS